MGRRAAITDADGGYRAQRGAFLRDERASNGGPGVKRVRKGGSVPTRSAKRHGYGASSTSPRRFGRLASRQSSHGRRLSRRAGRLSVQEKRQAGPEKRQAEATKAPEQPSESASCPVDRGLNREPRRHRAARRRQPGDASGPRCPALGRAPRDGRRSRWHRARTAAPRRHRASQATVATAPKPPPRAAASTPRQRGPKAGRATSTARTTPRNLEPPRVRAAFICSAAFCRVATMRPAHVTRHTAAFSMSGGHVPVAAATSARIAPPWLTASTAASSRATSRAARSTAATTRARTRRRPRPRAADAGRAATRATRRPCASRSASRSSPSKTP